MVRDLEHRRAQVDALVEEGRFARGLDVAGEEEADAPQVSLSTSELLLSSEPVA